MGIAPITLFVAQRRAMKQPMIRSLINGKSRAKREFVDSAEDEKNPCQTG